jgi:long-chain acyl-CoA synthetase
MAQWDTLCGLLDSFHGYGPAPAVVSFRPDGVDTLSYQDLAERGLRLAMTLSSAGAKKGDRVLLIAPNGPDWIIGLFAIVCSGAAAVLLDDQSNTKELSRAAVDSGARYALVSPKHASILASLGTIPHDNLLVLGRDTGPAEGCAGHPPFALPGLDPNDAALLLYTSGTTGTPKAVPLTHQNILVNVQALAHERLAGPGDRVALPLPLHHAYPLTVGLLTALAIGAAVLFPADLSGPQLMRMLKEGRATALIGVPRLYVALLAAIESRIKTRPAVWQAAYRAALRCSIMLHRVLGVRVGRVVFRALHMEIGPDLVLLACGGARLEPDVAWSLEGLGWEVLLGYGLTETSPVLTFTPRRHARLDSVGQPLTGVEIRIDTDSTQSFGEVLARGPNVFAGYRNDPSATRQAFTADGWFRTGDLGYLDPEGNLHIVGRVKETIVLSDGRKVFPESIEEAYAASPLIQDIAVLEQEGSLTALIVPDEDEIRRRGAVRAGQQLRDAVEDISLSLPPYQRISVYRVTREKLPRTLLGKFQRHLLPDIYRRATHADTTREPSLPTPEDRALLSSPFGSAVWTWLVQRFPEKPLTLDTSPQLDLGVDSLEWVTLTLEIQDRFGIVLTQEATSRIVTLRDLVMETASAAADQAKLSRRTAAPTFPLKAQGLADRGSSSKVLGLILLAANRLLIRALFRLKVEGTERLPEGGPLVVTPNHASFLDPLAVAAALPWSRLRHTYWAGWTGIMFAGPISRWLSRATNVFPVDPDRDPFHSLVFGASILERGETLVWFPEGRRSADGSLGAFLPGIAHLLQQTGVQAVPTLILGTFEALPRQRRWPRFISIKVIFGVPRTAEQLATDGVGKDTTARITDGLRRAVVALASMPSP